MKTIKIYCGESIEHFCHQQLHPVNEVKKAEKLVKSPVDIITYSNSPEFISAIKYISLKENVEVEFFLNDISCGSDTEPIFEDFNKAMDLLTEITK